MDWLGGIDVFREFRECIKIRPIYQLNPRNLFWLRFSVSWVELVGWVSELVGSVSWTSIRVGVYGWVDFESVVQGRPSA